MNYIDIMGNNLFNFLRCQSCDNKKGDCNTCMIQDACEWFLAMDKILTNITYFLRGYRND